MALININNVRYYNKNKFPDFYGIKEYGNVASFELTSYSWDKINKMVGNNKIYFNKSNRLNVYENGRIDVSKIEYDYDKEYFEEELDYEFNGEIKNKVEKELNHLIMFESYLDQHDLNELVEYLQKGDF